MSLILPKTLEKVLHAPYSDKEHQRLLTLAANWRALLAFDDGAPKLANALEAFAAAYQQRSPDLKRLHDEVVFQADVYRMRHYVSGPGRLRDTFMESSGSSLYHLFMASMGGTCPRAFWGMW